MGMSKPALSQVIKSVLAAAIGVQSNANRERDFKSGSLGVYLVVGAVATVLFIGTIILIVSLVVWYAKHKKTQVFGLGFLIQNASMVIGF